MTEQTQQNILDYFMGSSYETSHTDVPYFKYNKELNISLDDYVKEQYSDVQTWIIDLSLQRGDYVILFCSDYDNNQDTFRKSFIIVLGQNYQPIKYIDSYSSGTEFRRFKVLNDNDTGTGVIYIVDAVSYTLAGNEDNQYRLLILNDFTQESWQIKVNSSWYIPQNNDYYQKVLQFAKKSDAGRYAMLVKQIEDVSSDKLGNVLEFVNNVGSSNEWNYYTYTGDYTVYFTNPRAVFGWSEDSLTFKIIFQYAQANGTQLLMCKEGTYNDTNAIVDERVITFDGIDSGVVLEFEKIVHAGNYFYIETSKNTNVLKKWILTVNINTYATDIMIVNRYTNPFYQGDDYTFLVLNNRLFWVRNRWEFAMDDIENGLNIVLLGQVYGDNHYVEAGVIAYDISEQRSISTMISGKNIYNFYGIGIIFQDRIFDYRTVYNANNYNGKEYTSKYSVVSNSGEIYENNGGIVFARNLYNRTISGSTTTSTIQIPADYLNSITIGAKDLMSLTNSVISEDTSQIQKNMYEVMYLNFINTINMVNNNTSTSISNSAGASVLNLALTDPDTYYEGKQCNKLRINYTDNTSEVLSAKGVSVVNDRYIEGRYWIIVNIDVKKAIDVIQFISNDETTVYCEVDGSNFEVGKTYEIRQRVRANFYTGAD